MKHLPALSLFLLATVAAGCASEKKGNPSGMALPQSQTATSSPKPVMDLQQLRSALMSAGDELMFSVSDACAQVLHRTERPDARSFCLTLRLGVAISAISAATAPNPRVGYADLLTLATLERMVLEEPAAKAILDEPDRELLLRTLTTAEQRTWARTDPALTPLQQGELRELIMGWRRANPDRASVSQLRLQDFENLRMGNPAAAKGSTKMPSILGLLRIDPMEGLSPATRQLEETRQFAERAAFWGQRLPLVLGWQIELTGARLLNDDAITSAERSAAKFSQATADFARSADDIASTYKLMLEDLPKERQAAIEQLDRATAAQLKSTLEQLDRATAAQVTATIQQLDRATSTQVKSAIDQSAAAIATERKAALDQLGQEFTQHVHAAIEKLAHETDAQTARFTDRAGAALSAAGSRTLADTETTTRRLIDHLALALFLALTATAACTAIIAFAYRALASRSVAVVAPPAPVRSHRPDPLSPIDRPVREPASRRDPSLNRPD